MKQFIVLAAILPILLVFVSQFTLDAVRSLRMNAAEDAIRAFCLEAAYYGGGGAAEAEALRHRLAQIFKSDIRDINIELVRTDEAHIDWSLSFPIGDIMAGAAFMGLSPSENRGRVQMNGTIVIVPKKPEPLPPDKEPPDEENPPPPDDEPPEEVPPLQESIAYKGESSHSTIVDIRIYTYYTA